MVCTDFGGVTRRRPDVRAPAGANADSLAPSAREQKPRWDVAAGSKTVQLKKGARITGPERIKLAADLRKKYEKGQSIRALAEGTGRSYGFVHRLLLDAEVSLRGRGGATRTKKK
jgi:hypothetical protein